MTQPIPTVHPSRRAKVERDGQLVLAVRLRFNAKTGLTHLAAIEDLAKVKALLLAEVDTALKRLTEDGEPKAWPALKKEDQLIHRRQGGSGETRSDQSNPN